jgi:hypothetical protein
MARAARDCTGGGEIWRNGSAMPLILGEHGGIYHDLPPRFDWENEDWNSLLDFQANWHCVPVFWTVNLANLGVYLSLTQILQRFKLWELEQDRHTATVGYVYNR